MASLHSRQVTTIGIVTLSLTAVVLLTLFPLPLRPQAVSENAVLRGTIRDAQGKPVVSATVSLQAKDGKQAITSSDAQGNYRFTGLSSGEYVLRAEKAECGEAAIPSLVLGPKETKTVDLTLAPTKPAASQPPSSSPPAFFDEPQFTISGVTDTTSLGGHGSDTIVRARETIAKDTASLGEVPSGSGSVTSATTPYDKAKLHHLLAEIHEKLGDSLEAVHEYERAAGLDPSEVYLFDWGSELLLHHAPEPAREVFTKGNRLFPRSVRMLVGLGAAWFAQGSYDEAVRRICDASDLNPDDPVPYLFLGKMQSAENIPSDEVVEKLHRFVTLHPESAEANYYYAVGLWKRRTTSLDNAGRVQVESLLNNAVRLDPKFGAAYLQLGILHSESRDFAQAIFEYQQAIQVSPQMEDAHYRLVQAYRQTGESEKAKAEIQVYDQLAKESAQKAERERHEIPQFVYTLRDQPATQIP